MKFPATWLLVILFVVSSWNALRAKDRAEPHNKCIREWMEPRDEAKNLYIYWIKNECKEDLMVLMTNDAKQYHSIFTMQHGQEKGGQVTLPDGNASEIQEAVNEHLDTRQFRALSLRYFDKQCGDVGSDEWAKCFDKAYRAAVE